MANRKTKHDDPGITIGSLIRTQEIVEWNFATRKELSPEHSVCKNVPQEQRENWHSLHTCSEKCYKKVFRLQGKFCIFRNKRRRTEK
jgi:hypothetical protein